MLAKKPLGSPDFVDQDEAPELTADMLDKAEVFDGDKFIRRGRGRPPADVRKEKINVRLDPDVLERLRASGPGWQTRINEILRVSLNLGRT
ncbi:MAG: BrnA antitoxin family protein [Janthinobacterium lividum]